MNELILSLILSVYILIVCCVILYRVRKQDSPPYYSPLELVFIATFVCRMMLEGHPFSLVCGSISMFVVITAALDMGKKEMKNE